LKKETLRRADLVTTIILMCLSIFGLVLSIDLLIDTLNKEKDWYDSAGLFPMIVSCLLFLCASLLFVTARREGAKFDFISKSKFIEFLKLREFKVAVIVIGLLAFYIFVLIEFLPYSIATFIYLFTFMFCFQEAKTLKAIIKTLIISIIATIVLTYGFGTLAMIPLP